MKKSLTLLLAVLGLVLLGGCSTPTSRIKDHPEVFAKFSPEQQELIKKGQIALGFDQEMVKLALGSPDRVRVRMDSRGSKEVWSYTSYRANTSVSVYGGWGGYYPYYPRAYAPYYGGWGWGYGGMWGGYPYGYSEAYEHFRVEFIGGKVTSIEQEES